MVSRGGQLQISSLQLFHEGRYTCLAQSLDAEARKDFIVSVQGWSGRAGWMHGLLRRHQGSVGSVVLASSACGGLQRLLVRLHLSSHILCSIQWHQESWGQVSPASTASRRAEG